MKSRLSFTLRSRKVQLIWERGAKMAEYIEREAAEDAAGEAYLKGLNPVWAVRDVPTVDVVPVVRCKDCENAQNECGGMIICRVYKHIMWLQDFCSYGKRKDGGADNG